MAKKELDVTKIGYQKYKQLQEANNEQFSDPVLDDFRSNLRPIMGNMNPYVNATKDIPLPDMGHTPWGGSVYDKPNVNIEALKHLGDIRADEQSALTKIANGIAKGTILAGTTLLNGTVGLLAGLGEWAATGKVSKIWDNEISKGLDEFEKKSEEWLPNYYSEEELNTPWYENIFTANFWGDKFLKNLGFTIGAYYSGGLYTKGLGAILKGLKANSTVSTVAQSGIGSLISAVNEGSKEAINGADEYFNEHKPLLDRHYKEKLLAAKVAYEASKGKALEYRDGKLIDKAWLDYQDTLKNEENNYKKALARLEEDRAKVGNTILALNIPVLTASNWYQFGKLYSKGFNTSARATINNIEGTVGKYKAGNLSKASKAAKILGGGIAEGSEEMAQRNISDTQKHYYATDFNNFYRALHGLEAEEENLDWFKSAGLTIAKNFTDNGANAAWEEFTIGALTGLLGMPSFRGIKNAETGKFQSPVTLEGNAISKWRELSENAKRDQAIADKLNERVNSKEFKNYYLGQKRHQKYQNDMNDSAARNDEFDYKNAEHAQLLSDIEMFNNAGKLEDLKTAIGEAFDVSDKNLNAIIESTTSIDTDGNLVGPYAKYAKKNTDGSIVANLENKESKDEMTESLRSDKDRILDTVKNYETTREKLDRITNYRFTDENLNEITWLSTQLDNWENRASEMMGRVQDSIGNILAVFDNHKRFYEAIRDEEGKASADLTDEYRRADKNVRIISENIKILDSLRNADKQTVVKELVNHPGLIKNVVNILDKIDPKLITTIEQKELKTKLNDLLRLRDAYILFNNKFNEYLSDPNKLEEDHKNVDQQIAEQRAEQANTKKLESINKATTYKELQSLIDSEEVTIEDLNNSQSEIAKSYKKAALLRKKASEIIEGVKDMPSQQRSIFNQMLASKFNNESSYEDLINTQLIPELPLEAQILDDNIKESLIGMFGEIIKKASEKVNSGEQQKQDVATTPNSTTKPENAGKDDVMLPPQQSEDLSDIMSKTLAKSKLAQLIKEEVTPLIAETIKNLKVLKTNYDKVLKNKVEKSLKDIVGFIGEEKAKPLVDEFNSVSKEDKLANSSLDEVLKEIEEEAKNYEPTAVTGVLKAVVPQFDLDAKRDGVLIDFVGDDRNRGYVYVYNKLKEINPKTGKNAFDYVNEGNIKEGDELEVRYEEATDEHPELLALYHNGILVNYMNTNETIKGVKEIKDKAKKGEQSTVRVSKIMDGQYSYDRTKAQSIGDLLGTEDATIGVMKSRNMEANTDEYIEPVYNEANSDGKVYILLPNSKGTLTPKQIYIRHLNKEEYDLDKEDNDVAKEVRSLFREMADLSQAKDPESTLNDDIFPKLASVLYLPDSFHINVDTRGTDLILQIAYDENGKRKDENITLIKNYVKSFSYSLTGESGIKKEPTPIDSDEVYKQVIEAFYKANLAFNISAKELAGKNGQEYANKLKGSNVLFTYITSKRMQGTWFLLNDAPKNNLSNTAFKRQKAKDANKVGTKIDYNGITYYVNLVTDTIYDGTNNIVELNPGEAKLVRDLAYIQHTYGSVLYGVNQLNGKVVISDKDGKRGYDRIAKRYLTNEELSKLENELLALKDAREKTTTTTSDLMSDQKLVKRKDDGSPDTTDQYYLIMEEDNQYHKYQRVHSVLDEIYGKQYIGPTSSNQATSKGTLIDNIARQFFINPNISKPEGISQKAFSDLKQSLEKFRDKLNKQGFIIKTDRIVIFNKYSDGTRIAGELDMYAYNPTTGEVRIYDFKTSKWSSKNTAFSVAPSKNYTRSNKEQYTLQLSTYARLFEDRYGKEVSKLIILPLWIRYNNNSIYSLISEDEIALEPNKQVIEGYTSSTPTEVKTDIESKARSSVSELSSIKPKTPTVSEEDYQSTDTVTKPKTQDTSSDKKSFEELAELDWKDLDQETQNLFISKTGTDPILAEEIWEASNSDIRKQQLEC